MGNGNQNQKEDPNRLRVEFPNGAIASGTPTMLGRLINRVAETNPKEVGKTGSSASKGLGTSIPSTSGGSTKIKTTSVATAATSKENTDGMVKRIQKGAINMAQNAQKGAVENAQNAPKKAVEMAQTASELKEKLRRKFFPKPWEKPEYQALYFARQHVPKNDAPRIDPEVFIGKKKKMKLKKANLACGRAMEVKQRKIPWIHKINL